MDWQIFLDMAVLVEAQGELLDNIETQVGSLTFFTSLCLPRMPSPFWNPSQIVFPSSVHPQHKQTLSSLSTPGASYNAFQMTINLGFKRSHQISHRNGRRKVLCTCQILNLKQGKTSEQQHRDSAHCSPQIPRLEHWLSMLLWLQQLYIGYTQLSAHKYLFGILWFGICRLAKQSNMWLQEQPSSRRQRPCDEEHANACALPSFFCFSLPSFSFLRSSNLGKRLQSDVPRYPLLCISREFVLWCQSLLGFYAFKWHALDLMRLQSPRDLARQTVVFHRYFPLAQLYKRFQGRKFF